jgi:hypothetical protein
MVFNAIFNYISVISWLSCFIGGVYWENHRPAASLTNFIHNVSSNKGVLIAGIYIHTTVYINLKITPPSKPQSIELEIRSSFSTEQYNFGWEATVQSAPTFDQNVPIFFKGRESSSCVTQIRYTTPMKVVMVMWSIATTWHPLSSVNVHN